MRPHLIVNPASAGGRTGRHFDTIARAVHEALGDFDHSFTRGRGEAAELARGLVRAGVGLVVAVGGDGTVSEVADGLAGGLLDARAGGGGSAGRLEVVLGCIPRGTGADLRRTLGWPTDARAAARLLSAAPARDMDLGLVELTGHDGSPVVRHFANVAGFGVAGRVVELVELGGKRVGGKLSFMIASARALLGWRDQPVRWRVDKGPWREERITSVAVCNGRFFGGGMMVAPDARVDDGLFDVTVWKGLGLVDFALKQGMLYDGSHVRLPNTERLRARVLEAEPLGDATVLLDVDGESLGRLPARFTLLPGVLRVSAPDWPPP